MKRTILLFILITGIANHSLIAQEGNHKVEILKPVVQTYYEPAGVLTVNTENKLRFQSVDAKRLLVNASQGTVKQQGKDFILTPEKTGDLALAIYNYDDIENPVLIEERYLKVVSSPVALIAGKNGGNISKEEFLKAEKVTCTEGYRITEFKLSTSGKGVGYHEFERKGEYFSPEMIAAVQQLPTGGKIFIEYIRARPENSEGTRQIAPLAFTLTE